MVEHWTENPRVSGSKPFLSEKLGYSQVGKTTDFDSVIEGSSPSIPKIITSSGC